MRERIDSFTKPGKFDEHVWGMDQSLDDAGRGLRRDWVQKRVQPRHVIDGRSAPRNDHPFGGGSGFAVERLSAQATTAR
jgi:hypothetical protein